MILNKNILSVLFSLFAYGMFVVMDSIAKYLTDFMSIQQIVWGRYFFHFIITIIIVSIFRIKINLKQNYNIQIFRSAMLIAGSVFMYIAVKNVDLVNIYIVFFTSPLFLVLFSVVFLKEKISNLGLILMVLSFFSIVYSLGKPKDFFSIFMIFPLAMAISFALYQFFTKKISNNRDPFVAVFYSGLLGSFFFSIVLYLDRSIFVNDFWIYLLLMGSIGFVSHFLLVLAIQYSDVSFVSHFQYSQLVWASLINIFIFNIDLNYQKIIGIILIILFGILFVRTELKN